MARNGRRLRRASAITEVSLTPLIDTALTLLIIFMVTTPMINNSLKIDLPKGKVHEAGTSKQEVVVHVDKSEKVFLNGKQYMHSELMKELPKLAATAQDKTVFVKADQQVRYGHVIELVDQIKMVAGIDYVALATKKSA